MNVRLANVHFEWEELHCERKIINVAGIPMLWYLLCAMFSAIYMYRLYLTKIEQANLCSFHVVKKLHSLVSSRKMVLFCEYSIKKPADFGFDSGT